MERKPLITSSRRETITSMSNRKWLDTHQLKLQRYLRRQHKREDRGVVFNLIFNEFPDEGRKLVSDFDLSETIKKEFFLKWLIYRPQITCGVFGDQRMGKDALICQVFEEVIQYCKTHKLNIPRFVTLGNVRKPPFVTEDDMYFSFKNIPSGTKNKEVWIYSSEIEVQLPSRQALGEENKLYSMLEGTMAQNHQKLFGCCKLASKVDINFIRSMNIKLFKFISRDKLRMEGVERSHILSELGLWLLPKDVTNFQETLLSFNDQLFKVNYDLPKWWNDDYSEQYRDIPMNKIEDFIEDAYSNDLGLHSIQIAVAQKFRKSLSLSQLKSILEIDETKPFKK